MRRGGADRAGELADAWARMVQRILRELELALVASFRVPSCHFGVVGACCSRDWRTGSDEACGGVVV